MNILIAIINELAVHFHLIKILKLQPKQLLELTSQFNDEYLFFRFNKQNLFRLNTLLLNYFVNTAQTKSHHHRLTIRKKTIKLSR